MPDAGGAGGTGGEAPPCSAPAARKPLRVPPVASPLRRGSGMGGGQPVLGPGQYIEYQVRTGPGAAPPCGGRRVRLGLCACHPQSASVCEEKLTLPHPLPHPAVHLSHQHTGGVHGGVCGGAPARHGRRRRRAALPLGHPLPGLHPAVWTQRPAHAAAQAAHALLGDGRLSPSPALAAGSRAGSHSRVSESPPWPYVSAGLWAATDARRF